jgi:hypothetical protein
MANPQIDVITRKILASQPLSKNDIAYLVDRLITNPPASEGGGSYTASNGLTLTDTEFSLGNTTITQAMTEISTVSDDASSYSYLIFDRQAAKTGMVLGGSGAAGESNLYIDPEDLNALGSGIIVSLSGDNTFGYAADYSATFTDRSLADWGNVWKAKGSTSITESATITVGTDLDLIIRGNSDSGESTGAGWISIGPGTDGNYALILGAGLALDPLDYADLGVKMVFQADPGNIIVHANNGIKYYADLSNNYEDRSLADWGNVWKRQGTTTIWTNDGEDGTVLVEALTYLKLQSATTGGETAYLNFNSGITTYVDNTTNPKGIRYNADYSNSFLDRSLADWGNVWKVKGTTSLTAATFIDGNNNNIQIGSNLPADATDRSYITLASTGGGLIWANAANTTVRSLVFNSTGATLTAGASASATGLLYAADYSANYTSRSLVDKAYADLNQLTSYTVGTLPAATTAGRMIYVSNETGGATPAFSDGTNWRRVADRAIVA